MFFKGISAHTHIFLKLGQFLKIKNINYQGEPEKKKKKIFFRKKSLIISKILKSLINIYFTFYFTISRKRLAIRHICFHQV